MNKELKPCPFCGDSTVAIVSELDDFGYKWYFVSCCGRGEEFSSETRDKDTSAKEKAIEAWNNRPHEQELEAENKRMKDNLEYMFNALKEGYSSVTPEIRQSIEDGLGMPSGSSETKEDVE